MEKEFDIDAVARALDQETIDKIVSDLENSSRTTLITKDNLDEIVGKLEQILIDNPDIYHKLEFARIIQYVIEKCEVNKYKFTVLVFDFEKTRHYLIRGFDEIEEYVAFCLEYDSVDVSPTGYKSTYFKEVLGDVDKFEIRKVH